jgi:hypothetical protein
MHKFRFVKKNRPLSIKLLILICLLLYLTCITFFLTYTVINISNNIDGSWVYTISSLRHSTQSLGVDVFYTYGPLFQRLATYPLPADSVSQYVITVAIYLTVATGMISVLYRFIVLYGLDREIKSLFALLLLSLYTVITIGNIDSVFYLSLIILILTARVEKKLSSILLYISIISLFSMYKVSFLIATLVTIPFILLININKYSIKKVILLISGSYLFYIALYSLISFSSPINFIKYITIGLVNTSNYTEFMSLSVHENMLLVGIFGLAYFVSISLTTIFLFIKNEYDIKSKILFYTLFFILFLVFKQSIVRSDGHLITFAAFIPIIVLLPSFSYNKMLLSKINRSEYYVLLLYFAIAVGVYTLIILKLFGVQQFQSVFRSRIRLTKEVITMNPISYSSFVATKSRLGELTQPREQYVQNTHSFLRANSIDTLIFFGNTTAISSGLKDINVLYMPFIQNYAAFPPQLFDVEYLKYSQKYPDTPILLDEIEPSINERIPSYELNTFFQFLKNNYQPIFIDKDKKLYILKQKNNYKHVICKDLTEEIYARDEFFSLPSFDANSGEYINMKVSSKNNYLNKIFSTLFKSPLYSIEFMNKNSDIQKNRITLSTLEHGVAVTPFYTRYTDYLNNDSFEINKVRILGGVIKNDIKRISFERCGYQ